MVRVFTARNVENRAHSCDIKGIRYHFKFVGERGVSGVVGQQRGGIPRYGILSILQLELDPVLPCNPV